MIREAAISIYLFIFKVFFLLFRMFPLKNKATFVSSFGDNCSIILQEMKQQNIPYKTVFLKAKKSKANIEGDGETIVFNYGTPNILHWLASVYHLATAKVIIIDNYFAFLSAASFKPEVKCVQVWHAAGAVKRFGLQDPSNINRSSRANKRFSQVYKQFHYATVGSESMAHIYKESFGLQDQNILKTGVPRTDFFFNEKAKSEAIHSLQNKYPDLTGKKTILYAPTYREDQLNTDTLSLDIDVLHQKLFNEGCVLLLKLHPAVTVSASFENDYPGFLYNLSHYHDINELLLITDLLITDYSSIPFEYSLLGRPMIFYPYDLEEYEQERGFWEDYVSTMPGPVVFSTDAIVEEIMKNNMDQEILDQFKHKWNEYSTGSSAKKLVDFLF
ncbi:CDP-glycerol glycerophosphotransferase (TagB/SpsB family) [Peribacillus deserti]|uniref:CDP-glycerol glycerophosphotransferase (TagB/SpsB family) n=1 Tax=Peribacillus deserti TaxID=673318 RepID=A0ABS2QDV0_9BACI|nr:CDP-glycerol glycerophosphotransferase family protein [Peribacillus deserti]MBM7690859.1 CDP-glycerol glycerophosphotransferase (TagB/SpsB family) [Peribacillus deserti]